MTHRTRRPVSRASYELAAAGATQVALADALNVAQVSASRYLAGESPPPDGFERVLAQLVGRDAARRIIAAIPAGEPVAA